MLNECLLNECRAAACIIMCLGPPARLKCLPTHAASIVASIPPSSAPAAHSRMRLTTRRSPCRSALQHGRQLALPLRPAAALQQPGPRVGVCPLLQHRAGHA